MVHLRTRGFSVDLIWLKMWSYCSLNMGFARGRGAHFRGTLVQSFSFDLVKLIFVLLQFALRGRLVWMPRSCFLNSWRGFFRLREWVLGNLWLLSHSSSAVIFLEIWRFCHFDQQQHLLHPSLTLTMKLHNQQPATSCEILSSTKTASCSRLSQTPDCFHIPGQLCMDSRTASAQPLSSASALHRGNSIRRQLSDSIALPKLYPLCQHSFYPFCVTHLSCRSYCLLSERSSMAACGFLGSNRSWIACCWWYVMPAANAGTDLKDLGLSFFIKGIKIMW